MEPGVSLEAAPLFLWSRGKVVYILPSSDPTLTLLLVGLTDYYYCCFCCCCCCCCYYEL
ncbi:hypothetical protein Hanom_Chr00s000005g01611921 [Helianthus anomalus]